MPQTLRLEVTPATLALLRELTSNAVVDAGLDLDRQSSLSSFGSLPVQRKLAAGAYVAPEREIIALIAYLQSLGRSESVAGPKPAAGQ